MINAILRGIFSLVINLVNLLLVPIDNLIATYLPSLSSGIDAVEDLLSICCRSIGWVISATGVPMAAIQLLVVYYSFKLTVPILVYTIKLAIRWYHWICP